MNVGFGQLLILLVLVILLFGNLPKVTKEIVAVVRIVKEALRDEKF